MRIPSHFACILLLLALSASARVADVIDRVVATVNGHVILQSDWDDTVRFEAFVEGRPLDQLTDQDRRRALDRLIDQELLREQAQSGDAPAPRSEEVQQRIQDIQQQHSATEPGAWQSELHRYALNQPQLEAYIAHDLAVLHQVEARLRPAVQINADNVESYYRDTFLPQLRKLGAQEVPLEQVAGKIREILTEQKVSELFTSWLHSLRAESKITIPVPASAPASPSGGQAP